MSEKTFLIKEIIDRSVERSEIEGIFTLPFEIKEIYEVRPTVLPVRTFIGDQCVAYFGEIETKTYCVNANDSCVRLIEHLLHYKGFAFFQERDLACKPQISVKTSIEDLFVEVNDCDHLKITGVISTEIILTLEKEICLGDFQYYRLQATQCHHDHQGCVDHDRHDYHHHHMKESYKNTKITHSKSNDITEPTAEVRVDTFEDENSDVITEVTSSNNPNVIITVE